MKITNHDNLMKEHRLNVLIQERISKISACIRESVSSYIGDQLDSRITESIKQDIYKDLCQNLRERIAE